MKLRPPSIVAYLRKRNDVVLSHCYSTSVITKPREPHTCNTAPSLRLLVPSSLQVLRPSADANRHHLHSKIPLGPVGMIRRFWRAFTWSLASCSLLRLHVLDVLEGRRRPLALSGKSHTAGLPPLVPVQPLVTLLVFAAP
jgi:hypothetical protein